MHATNASTATSSLILHTQDRVCSVDFRRLHFEGIYA